MADDGWRTVRVTTGSLSFDYRAKYRYGCRSSAIDVHYRARNSRGDWHILKLGNCSALFFQDMLDSLEEGRSEEMADCRWRMVRGTAGQAWEYRVRQWGWVSGMVRCRSSMKIDLERRASKRGSWFAVFLPACSMSFLDNALDSLKDPPMEEGRSRLVAKQEYDTRWREVHDKLRVRRTMARGNSGLEVQTQYGCTWQTTSLGGFATPAIQQILNALDGPPTEEEWRELRLPDEDEWSRDRIKYRYVDHGQGRYICVRVKDQGQWTSITELFPRKVTLDWLLVVFTTIHEDLEARTDA